VEYSLLTNYDTIDFFYNLIDLLQNQGDKEDSCGFDEVYDGIKGEYLMSFLSFEHIIKKELDRSLADEFFLIILEVTELVSENCNHFNDIVQVT
jgi:hypothetical protein